MVGPASPVLIGYDGSEVARAAVRHAAELFAGRPAVLATVWEPGLAAVPVGLPDSIGVGSLPPDPATVEAVDRLQREHASTVAGDGAEFARSVGLAAEPQAVPDHTLAYWLDEDGTGRASRLESSDPFVMGLVEAALEVYRKVRPLV